MNLKTRRLLFLAHRWIGILSCLFMAMWFFSGVVMMYVGYPKLTPAERLAALPEVDLTNCCVAPLQAIAATGDPRPPRDLRLVMLAGEPTYLVTDAGGGPHAVRARTGDRVDEIDETAAVAAARRFSNVSATPRYLGEIREDAWTHSRALDPHRPLHRVALEDDAGTEVYVSSRTGEVVRDSTRVERNWNWVGAWLHWLYPLRGGFFDPAWTQIVIWLSLISTLGAVAGTIVGVLRWRLASPYRSGSRSPYRDPMMRWHHYTGLAFALATVLWIFSGLMSMNPWKIFDSHAPRLDTRSLSGGALDVTRFERSAASATRLASPSARAHELRWGQIDGWPYYLVVDRAGRTTIVPADARAPARVRFDEATLLGALSKSVAPARIASHVWIEQYDFHYYSRATHTMLGHVERPLPMLRVMLDDRWATWVHIDPFTGTIHNRIDARGRVKRWLFTLFHSWDWLPLLERRPLWDIVLIALSIGGFASCVTGIVIGWRRLRRIMPRPAQVALGDAAAVRASAPRP